MNNISNEDIQRIVEIYSEESVKDVKITDIDPEEVWKDDEYCKQWKEKYAHEPKSSRFHVSFSPREMKAGDIERQLLKGGMKTWQWHRPCGKNWASFATWKTCEKHLQSLLDPEKTTVKIEERKNTAKEETTTENLDRDQLLKIILEENEIKILKRKLLKVIL